MIELRTGNYTIYQGHILSLTELRNEVPISEDEKIFNVCYPFRLNLLLKGFTKQNNRYFKSLLKNQLDNAFYAQTYGLYKGISVKVFESKLNISNVEITTKEKRANNLSFFDMTDYFIKEVKVLELDKIWEERSNSTYNLPMPIDLPLYVEIDFFS